MVSTNCILVHMCVCLCVKDSYQLPEQSIASTAEIKELKVSRLHERYSWHSVQFSPKVCLTLWNPVDCSKPWPPSPSPSPGACSDSYPSSRWCHTTISSSIIPFSSCPQSFPSSGSFQMSQLFPSDGQSIGVSASTSVPPMNIQDWFPLGLTGLIFLQSKGLRVFSNTTVQKHQFIGPQLSLWSNSHIHTWPLENHGFD